MSVRYAIYPLRGYVHETFKGLHGREEALRIALRQQRDARLLNGYHRLSDYTQASCHFSKEDIDWYAAFLGADSLTRSGRHAIVVRSARNYAFATALQSAAHSHGIAMRCFTHADFALQWLLDREARQT